MQDFIATFHSSLSAWVILAPTIFTAGMAVAMRTAHNIIRYTMAETVRKWGAEIIEPEVYGGD